MGTHLTNSRLLHKIYTNVIRTPGTGAPGRRLLSDFSFGLLGTETSEWIVDCEDGLDWADCTPLEDRKGFKNAALKERSDFDVFRELEEIGEPLEDLVEAGVSDEVEVGRERTKGCL